MRDWRPTASREMLQLRAALLARARGFFAARGVLEVDTPIVVNAPVTDVHIHSARVTLTVANSREATARPYFLHTSPEYAMKRLLAAGVGDIYQICHVVRALERGRLHNAEFTLIEWYRSGASLETLMR
ncbi:MAG: amino acid--tRNA ligase-related protein, partial [Steroidobacteraceae bacterium]